MKALKEGAEQVVHIGQLHSQLPPKSFPIQYIHPSSSHIIRGKLSYGLGMPTYPNGGLRPAAAFPLDELLMRPVILRILFPIFSFTLLPLRCEIDDLRICCCCCWRSPGDGDGPSGGGALALGVGTSILPLLKPSGEGTTSMTGVPVVERVMG